MATLVTFHAHPDDECLLTGGVMAQAAADGHRVVLVTATGGEHGEVPEGFLPAGETLGERRRAELEASAEILGVERTELLGYVDSGMMGTPENEAPGSFWTADVEAAAGRLADILTAEGADVLTVYDANGGYGHPDHIQVHRVGVRAAELAGTAAVFEATINRDHLIRLMDRARTERDPADLPEVEDVGTFGVAESALTTAVDVTAYLDTKRRAMLAHPSQITETSFFLQMPTEAFADTFGTEWFIHRGAAPGIRERSLWG
jgi:LmbE family N-acetylglucosaminyl deacetylase